MKKLTLCQITSKLLKDEYSIRLDDIDFKIGSLKQSSNIRPNRLFTADKNIILYKVGELHDNKTNEVIEKIISLIKV